MEMRGRIRDAEANGYDVEEGRIGKDGAGAAEIGAGVEAKLVGAGGELVTGENRAIDPAIGIGDDGFEVSALAVAAHAIKIGPHPGRRFARRGIQHMRRQSTFGHPTTPLIFQPEPPF